MGIKFSVCEIVEMGIQIEKNGFEFYKALSIKIDDPKISEVFEYLADQENRHIDFFQGLFKKTCDYEPEGAYPEDYFSFMNALAEQYVFTKADQGKKMAADVKNVKEAISIGIKAEKDAIIFYEEMKKYVPQEDRSLIDNLIQEEKSHLVKLCDIKGGNQDDDCKSV